MMKFVTPSLPTLDLAHYDPSIKILIEDMRQYLDLAREKDALPGPLSLCFAFHHGTPQGSEDYHPDIRAVTFRSPDNHALWMVMTHIQSGEDPTQVPIKTYHLFRAKTGAYHGESSAILSSLSGHPKYNGFRARLSGAVISLARLSQGAGPQWVSPISSPIPL